MIVVDASAILDLLLRKTGWANIETVMSSAGQDLHAPHLLDVEIAQALRRHNTAREIGTERGQQALTDLADLPIHRYPHEILMSRIWDLRHNLTAYDAAYVALAELLGAKFLTRDMRLATSVQRHTSVELA